MSFEINEITIGVKGASGEACITQRMDGSIRDVICHMKIPGHWIFKTESGGSYDFLGYCEATGPIGKKGSINLEYYFGSPCRITYWNCGAQEIGWYGGSTDMSALQEEFKEMGKYLSSTEVKAEFDDLYEKGDPYHRAPELEEPNPVAVGASLSDEGRREKNRKARERAKARKQAAKIGCLPVGMVYSA